MNRTSLAVEGRLPGVDVLRGLAAILVVLHHIDIRFRINGYEVEPFLPGGLRQVLLDTGQYAVTCFFVISGFLITGLSLRRWGSLRQIPPREFYVMRAARILPLLLLVAAVSSVLHLIEVSPFVIPEERGTLLRVVIAALGFHVNWYEGKHGYLPGNWDVMWSLSVEEVFYLLFPLLCLTLRAVPMLLVLLALIVIGPFNRVWLQGIYPSYEYAYLSCMDGIAVGCLAGWLSQRRPLDPSRARTALIVGMPAVLLIVVFRESTRDLGLIATGMHLTVLEWGMALVLLAMSGGVGNAVLARGTAWLQFVGRCSYEIYLTHMLVVFGFFIAFQAVLGEQAPPQATYPASFALMLLASVLFGYGVSRWFSEPANRTLRAWLGKRPRPDPQVSAGASRALE